jgi:hypothetical protein
LRKEGSAVMAVSLDGARARRERWDGLFPPIYVKD